MSCDGDNVPVDGVDVGDDGRFVALDMTEGMLCIEDIEFCVLTTNAEQCLRQRIFF